MIISSQQIEASLNQFSLGLLTFQASVTEPSAELLSRIAKETTNILSEWTTDTITKRIEISAARSAYKACGKDPSRYRPSADSLMRRILKGNNLYKVNNVVDTLNLISLHTGISIGGYDINKIEGQIVFDKGEENEQYTGIGRGALNIKELPVLRDEKGAFGSPTSDSERTMITKAATQILFVFFDFGCSENLSSWLQLSEDLLSKYCKASGFNRQIIELKS